MATRRARLKGVLNIPPRKKPTQEDPPAEKQDNVSNTDKVQCDNKLNLESGAENGPQEQLSCPAKDFQDNLSTESVSDVSSNEVQNASDPQNTNVQPKLADTIKENLLNITEKPISSPNSEEKQSEAPVKVDDQQPKPPLLLRRKIKAKVSANVIRQAKQIPAVEENKNEEKSTSPIHFFTSKPMPLNATPFQKTENVANNLQRDTPEINNDVPSPLEAPKTGNSTSTTESQLSKSDACESTDPKVNNVPEICDNAIAKTNSESATSDSSKDPADQSQESELKTNELANSNGEDAQNSVKLNVPKLPIIRRKVLKPTVAAGSIKRKVNILQDIKLTNKVDDSVKKIEADENDTIKEVSLPPSLNAVGAPTTSTNENVTKPLFVENVINKSTPLESSNLSQMRNQQTSETPNIILSIKEKMKNKLRDIIGKANSHPAKQNINTPEKKQDPALILKSNIRAKFSTLMKQVNSKLEADKAAEQSSNFVESPNSNKLGVPSANNKENNVEVKENSETCPKLPHLNLTADPSYIKRKSLAAQIPTHSIKGCVNILQDVRIQVDNQYKTKNDNNFYTSKPKPLTMTSAPEESQRETSNTAESTSGNPSFTLIAYRKNCNESPEHYSHALQNVIDNSKNVPNYHFDNNEMKSLESEQLTLASVKRKVKILQDITLKCSTEDLFVNSTVNEISPFNLLNAVDIEQNPTEDVSAKFAFVDTPTSISQDGSKVASDDCNKTSSDVEYPAPPVSPTKILNRRIKAVPRLSNQRRSVHGSASESEDDSKRSYSRVRNDSVCSVASSQASQPLEDVNMVNKQELHQPISRRARRSANSRSYAEARRNYISKFNGSKPDRQKLTMLDLLFYNPTTNLMSEKKPKGDADLSVNGDSNEHVEEIINEEQEDDPDATTNEKIGDEEEEEEDDGMPAPQIKIDPNGEIIIDEKSLVVENQSTKINRNLMENAQVIDGDFDVSVGYKKVKRSKEWTKSETIRFYNALNTIGTDFMLMCELFPNRTRRELKLKFKKEERVNRQLVDKALTQPRQFDMNDLFKELENERRELEEIEKRRQERQKIKEEKKKLTIQAGICMPVEEENEENVPAAKRRKYKQKKRTSYDYVKGGILSVLQDTDDESSVDKPVEKEDSLKSQPTRRGRKRKKEAIIESSSEQSDDSMDEEIISVNEKPTRSGRVPKPRLVSPVLTDVGEDKPRKKRAKGKKCGRPKKPVVENTAAPPVEPGSIMIISTNSPEGEPVYQVFMVTPDQGKTEITLGEDILQNLTQSVHHQPNLGPYGAQNILTITAAPIPEEPIVENNMTIAEDGCESMRPVRIDQEENSCSSSATTEQIPTA